MEMIKSKDNKKLKNLRLLIEKASERRKQALFITEGLKMVNEAMSLGLAKHIFVSEAFLFSLENNKFTGSLKKEAERFKDFHLENENMNTVSETIFKSFSETVSPQGILAITEMPSYDKKSIIDKKEEIKLIVVEDISDPGNLGTIVRTAEAAGMSALIMSKQTVDIFNPKVVRSTMGSIFRLPFFYEEDLSKTIVELKEEGISFYAAHLKGKKSYKEIDYSKKSAVIIGNEARGISEEIASLCDTYVKIPMHGQVESLNAAIAAALMMYEL